MNPDYEKEAVEVEMMEQEKIIELIEKGYSTRKAKRQIEREFQKRVRESQKKKRKSFG